MSESQHSSNFFEDSSENSDLRALIDAFYNEYYNHLGPASTDNRPYKTSQEIQFKGKNVSLNAGYDQRLMKFFFRTNSVLTTLIKEGSDNKKGSLSTHLQLTYETQPDRYIDKVRNKILINELCIDTFQELFSQLSIKSLIGFLLGLISDESIAIALLEIEMNDENSLELEALNRETFIAPLMNNPTSTPLVSRCPFRHFSQEIQHELVLFITQNNRSEFNCDKLDLDFLIPLLKKILLEKGFYFPNTSIKYSFRRLDELKVKILEKIDLLKVFFDSEVEIALNDTLNELKRYLNINLTLEKKDISSIYKIIMECIDILVNIKKNSFTQQELDIEKNIKIDELNTLLLRFIAYLQTN